VSSEDQFMINNRSPRKPSPRQKPGSSEIPWFGRLNNDSSLLVGASKKFPSPWREGEGEPGTLFVVSTPLGNLEDITLRALRILKEVDTIAAETAEHTRNLCRHYGIATRLTSFNQHNQRRKGPELVKELKSGRSVALVTNAGTPAISDPGMFLVANALAEGIRVSPVPGASAVTAALSASGMRAESFLFCGFLSHRSGKRKKELQTLRLLPFTLVVFEAPHRLKELLEDLREVLGDRSMVLHKEMTKLFEGTVGGSVSSVLARLRHEEIRGEYTLVVAGCEKKDKEETLDEKVQKKMARLLRAKTMSLKDIARKISSETGVEYRRVYKACLAMKRAE
jgi:16S rRNA (cytidine1402-2'-O)-methyltransferase